MATKGEKRKAHLSAMVEAMIRGDTDEAVEQFSSASELITRKLTECLKFLLRF